MSSAAQALELRALNHGLFAYAVIAGLNGEADTDGQRVVTVKKLGTYLPRKTSALMQEHYPSFRGLKPVPQLVQSPAAGDHVMAVLGR